MGQLMTIPAKDFAEYFEQWKRCWENCVRSQGAYFEGDWGIIVLCIMFLVSSPINVSTFHSKWLDTFWTGFGILPTFNYLSGFISRQILWDKYTEPSLSSFPCKVIICNTRKPPFLHWWLCQPLGKTAQNGLRVRVREEVWVYSCICCRKVILCIVLSLLFLGLA